MVFYLRDSHVKIKSYHAFLCKFKYSVTKNDKVNNSSQEIHAITSYIDYEHIKGKDNVLADSLSRPMTLGLHEAIGHEELESGYAKSFLTKNQK